MQGIWLYDSLPKYDDKSLDIRRSISSEGGKFRVLKESENDRSLQSKQSYVFKSYYLAFNCWFD